MIRVILKKLKLHLGDKILQVEETSANEWLIRIVKKDLPEIVEFLYDNNKIRFLNMIGNDERSISGKFALYYIFLLSDIKQCITLKMMISEDDPTFPSLSIKLPALDWYEREVNDLLGLRAVGHPNRTPLINHGRWDENSYPLRKDFKIVPLKYENKNNNNFMQYLGNDITQIPVGPIHAGIIEPGHFRFGAVGEKILHLDAKLFYTHRGIEKSLEGKTLEEASFIIERICGVCNVSHSASFVLLAEKLSQTKISERAQYLRVLFLELERLYNHVGDTGNICAGFGFAVAVSQGSILKEKLLRLNEDLTGHRYLRGAIVLGGVSFDIDNNDINKILRFMDDLQIEYQDLVEIIFEHEIALNRMQKTGTLTYRQVCDLEVVGVAARASGRDIDCRRDTPYLCYDKLKFAVQTTTYGDVLDRLKIRVLEVRESINIIRQILNDLPNGELTVSLQTIKAYESGFAMVESPRGEDCHWMMVNQDGKIYRYRISSASYSNWPAVCLAVTSDIIPDFPLINKSFELCYACCDR